MRPKLPSCPAQDFPIFYEEPAFYYTPQSLIKQPVISNALYKIYRGLNFIQFAQSGLLSLYNTYQFKQQFFSFGVSLLYSFPTSPQGLLGAFLYNAALGGQLS